MPETTFSRALHELAIRAMRMTAAVMDAGSPGRAAFELRIARAAGIADASAAKAFAAELERDWRKGQFSSSLPGPVRDRSKILLDAAVDALRTAAHADATLVFPASDEEVANGAADDLVMGRKLRDVGEAIAARLKRILGDRKELIHSLEALVRQVSELEGGGDQLGRDLNSVNEVIQEVSTTDTISPALRNRLLSRAGALTARMGALTTQISNAQEEVAQAKTRIVGLEIQLKEREQEALSDKLTGLPNRRSLDSMLPAAAQQAHQRGEPLTIVMIDIDHFKRCNDTYGHRGGDAVLAEVAARLRAEMRGSDFAARYGGEEFSLVLPGCSLILGQRVAERVRQAIARRPIVFEGKTISVTISLGIAELQPKESVGQAIERADKALYGAKNAGRNRWVAAV